LLENTKAIIYVIFFHWVSIMRAARVTWMSPFGPSDWSKSQAANYCRKKAESGYFLGLKQNKLWIMTFPIARYAKMGKRWAENRNKIREGTEKKRRRLYSLPRRPRLLRRLRLFPGSGILLASLWAAKLHSSVHQANSSKKDLLHALRCILRFSRCSDWV